jgi:two-component system response regulator RegX3
MSSSSSSVLVVDDDPGVLDVVSFMLRREGFDVDEESEGTAALAAARDRRYDIVILDVMLPGMSGTDICRELRAESDVPILMLTARDAELDRVLGLELGADDYVTKPFSLRELSARIRAIFRRGEALVAGQLPPTVELGPVRVDVAGHRILRDGREIAVKPKVFELLAFLLRHPGQVVTRDQLLEQVWGYDYAGETRTVDVHVHWLRAAIEPDPGSPSIIRTVRGVGYVLRRPGAVATA